MKVNYLNFLEKTQVAENNQVGLSYAPVYWLV